MVVRRFLVPLALLCLAVSGRAAAETAGGGSRPAQMGWLDAGSGDYACAVQTGGVAVCWGRNDIGQLGDGTTGPPGGEPAPVRVHLPAGRRAVSVSAGDFRACAVLDDGGVVCWGAVGGAPQPTPLPVPLPSGSRAAGVSVGDQHACAVLEDGTAWCWGQDNVGQLGNGPAVTGPQTTPTRVLLPAGRSARAVTAGLGHTCAVMDDGSAWCWGFGTDGQLGAGPAVMTNQEAPVRVALPAGRTAIAISAGVQDSCAVLDDGTAWCWGSSAAGQLGGGQDPMMTQAVPTPARVLTPSQYRVTDITTSGQHTCAALDDRQLMCWGFNYHGALGTGAATDSVSTPEFVHLPSQRSITGFTTGSGMTCGALDNGSVTCWGDDMFGQLGNGPPTAVQKDPGLAPVTLSAGLVPGQVADLSISVIPTADTLATGRSHAFTVTLTNQGPDPATGVRVELRGAGLTLSGAAASHGTVSGTTWALDLYRGATATLTVTATPTTPGANTLTAEVSAADQVDPDSVPGNGVAGEDDQATATITTPAPTGTRGGGTPTGGGTGTTAGTRATRKHPRALSLRVVRLVRSLRVTGVLGLPSGATCAGTVTVTARHGTHTVRTTRARLHRVARRCTFTGILHSQAVGLVLTARFGGTATLTPISSARRRI